MNRPRRYLVRRITVASVATAGLVALWVGYPWLVAPGTFRFPVVFGILIVIAGAFHVTAAYRFQRMTVLIRRAERQGLAKEGSELFAANQRFRFFSRVVEAVISIGLVVLIVVAELHPKIAISRWYGAYVLTYFLGRDALTGYLTYRDLAVIGEVKRLNTGEAAQLSPVGGDRETSSDPPAF